MKNVIIFHGTEGYPEENWFPWLKDQFEQKGYQVTVPQLPSPPKVPAKLSEWFKVFEQYSSQIDQDTVLIGHSLGGKFLLRVLEQITSPIATAVFVGTPIGVLPIANNERDNAFTDNSFNWAQIKNKAHKFIVFQSDDDPYVSLGNGEELAKQLDTELNFVPNAGHFNTKAGYTQFPELLKEILS